MTEPKDIAVEGVNLESFERAVYACDGTEQGFENIAIELLGIFGKIRKGGGFQGQTDEVVLHLYTRLCGAITAFLTDPRSNLSPDGFARLCGEHAQLHALFRASAYGTMDHILAVLGTRDPANEEAITFTGNVVMKLLLCWSLDSEVSINFEEVANTAPAHAAAAMLGMLSVGGTHSERAYERRLMLMRNRHLIDAVPLADALIQSAGDCYMHCSYTDAADKHEIKRVLNRKLREIVSASFKVPERSRHLERKDRPTIVVPLEWFSSHHAMFRCYAPSLRQLRERFRLVAVFRADEVDQDGRDVFDKCVELSQDQANIAYVMQMILNEQPDILYYPSLGMAAWYVALSNFRLAPIQVISPGHPASSMSDCIDYMVSEGDLYGDPSNYTERLMSLPVGSVRYVSRDAYTVPPLVASTDGRVRLAIPASAMKIVPPFLAALARIKAEARTPIEYHFFPNMTGLAHTVISRDLRRWFPDAVIHPRTGYQTYLEWLSQCDGVLSTFPFGGTNSIIDCFLLGLPMVTLEGEHVHGRSDASMMRRVGLPPELITHSVDQYVTVARKMADMGMERRLLQDHLRCVDVRREFFGAPPDHLCTAFLDAFERIYQERLDEQHSSGVIRPDAGRDSDGGDGQTETKERAIGQANEVPARTGGEGVGSCSGGVLDDFNAGAVG